MANAIKNGDFELGLANWHILTGQAFNGQPVAADSVRAETVKINGKDVVPLGGDYWHVPFPVAEAGTHLVRIVSEFQEVLDSDVFTIGLRYLSFQLGGSATTGVALELRVPAATARGCGIRPLDIPDADDFVAVRVKNPSGSDILRQYTWDLFGRTSQKSLLNAKAKVRLRINRGRGEKRLAAGKIHLLSRPPRPLHLPLWGWADIHCHPMAQAGFGGLLAGHMHGPIEDLGSCLHEHGINHSSLVEHLAISVIQPDTRNDGGLAVTGWPVKEPEATDPILPDRLGFQGWPSFDDLTHIKTHQDWIRRAYEGGQRLMVALVVHNEMLAGLAPFPPVFSGMQSDRDTIEPQVQMLKEFVVHNRDWCGLAKTAAEARALGEQNKLTFVLGLETDSINGWIYQNDFDTSDTPSNRKAIRDAIYPYFEYLRNLGIVQINLIHLSDNAFGGMAMYEPLSLYNTWQRTGQMPTGEDGYFEPGSVNPRPADEQISKPVSLPAELLTPLNEVAKTLGITLPQPWASLSPPRGHRNVRSLTIAGQEALRVAMRLGMVIDMDHMSERSTDAAFKIATSVDDVKHQPYPLIVAHNGARYISPRPLSNTAAAVSGSRRNTEFWPSEGAKSDRQITYVLKTGGIFGHGTSGGDARDYPEKPNVVVKNDCPGTDKTFAQSYLYVTEKLDHQPGAVALGTDLNVLLAGLGPRFGTRSAGGLIDEIPMGDTNWQAATSQERLNCAEAQNVGVLYDTPLRDWRTYRFPDKGLHDPYPNVPGHLMWQAMALGQAMHNDSNLTWDKVKGQDPELDQRVIDMVVGMGIPGTPVLIDFYRAGLLMNNQSANLQAENQHVRDLVPVLRKIGALWKAMGSDHPALKRSTAGPFRDFDFNLDGLAHYGLLPDMLQDLKNVGLPLAGFFSSAERYIQVWERSTQVGARIQL